MIMNSVYSHDLEMYMYGHIWCVYDNTIYSINYRERDIKVKIYSSDNVSKLLSILLQNQRNTEISFLTLAK